MWRHGPLALLMACAMLSLGVGPEGSSLVFVEETPLELSLSEAQKGANLGVCNVGAKKLTKVKAQPKGFDPSLNADVKVTKETIGTLDPGDCRTVLVETVQGSAPGTPGTGTYRGVVMLSANQVEPVARQVVVTVGEPEKSIFVAAKPIRVTMWWPSNITRIDRPSLARWPILMTYFTPYAPYVRLMNYPVPYAPWPWWPPEKQVELPLRSKGRVELEVKKKPALGTVSGGFGDGHATVVAAENFNGRVKSGGVHPLAVHVDGLEGVGTYTGTLTIDGVDTDVELFVSDALLWPFVFLLLGVALAGAALFLAKRLVPNSRLKRRCHDLKQRYKDALENFQDNNLLNRRKNALIEQGMSLKEADLTIDNLRTCGVCDTSVQEYQERFDQLLTDYRKENYFFDTGAEDYEQLLTTLESAESDSRHLGNPEGLGKSLQDLALALYRFEKYLREDLELHPTLRPALVKPAAAKLKGGPLKVRAAKEISEQAKVYTGLIADWRKSVKQIIRYYRWAALLEAIFKDMNPKPEDDWKALQSATGRIVEALNELLDAEDAAALKELGAAEDLKEAYKTLATLGGKYCVWQAPVEPGTEVGVFRGATRIFVQSPDSPNWAAHCLRPQSDPASPQSIAALAASLPFESPSPRPPRVNVRRPTPIATTVLSIGLALVIALAVAFAAIYPATGAAFGTSKDYLAAITAGATGGTLSRFLQTPLTTLLTRLRPGS